MILVESKHFASFLLEHKLAKAHCTVWFNSMKSTADYVIETDTCVYHLHENEVIAIADQSDGNCFAFEIPSIIQFMIGTSAIKMRCTGSGNQTLTQTLELMCDHPYFTAIVKCDNIYTEPFESFYNIYEPLAPYAPVVNAIKKLKGLASELSTSMSVEFGRVFWTVSTSQSCLFGAATGIIGSISSELFERIYDYKGYICQPTKTTLVIKKTLDYGFYAIHVPIKTNNEFTTVIPTLVERCNKIVCTSDITRDVSTILGEIIKNVKRETVQLVLTEGRVDIIYNTMSMSLTTVPKGLDTSKGLTIKVPVKALASIADLISGPTEVSTNGDLICLMKDNKGLIMSGIFL